VGFVDLAEAASRPEGNEAPWASSISLKPLRGPKATKPGSKKIPERQ